MNRYLTFVAPLFLSAAAHAQGTTNAYEATMKQYTMVMHANGSANTTGSRGTNVDQRLIAEAEYTRNLIMNTYALTDSARYTYGSNERGAKFIQTIASNPWQIQADREVKYKPLNGVVAQTSTRDNSYDLQQRLVSRIDSPGGAARIATTIYYNSAGNPERTIQQQTSTTPLDSGTFTTYHQYNTAQVLVSDSSVNVSRYQGQTTPYTTVFKTDYSYNTAGNQTQLISYNLTGGNMDPMGRTITSYDAQQRINAIVQAEHTGMAWQTTTRDSFLYEGTSPTVMQVSSYYAGRLSYKVYRHNDGAGQLVYYTLYQYQSRLEPTDSVVYQYNSYGNPVTALDYTYNNFGLPTSDPTYKTTYYYELHTTAIGTAKAMSSFRLYPNPATGMIYIEGKGVAGDALITYQVLDINGRKLVQVRAPYTGRETGIDISQLAPGLYRLAVLDAGGLPVYTGAFVKAQ